MIDLYLVFFLVGGIIFAGIVWYSIALQRGRDDSPREEYVDPLFAELEDTKAKQKSLAANELDSLAKNAGSSSDAFENDTSSEPTLDNSDIATQAHRSASKSVYKQEPRLLDEDVSNTEDSANETAHASASESDVIQPKLEAREPQPAHKEPQPGNKEPQPNSEELQMAKLDDKPQAPDRESLPVIEETAPEKLGRPASKKTTDKPDDETVASRVETRTAPKIEPSVAESKGIVDEPEAGQKRDGDKPVAPKEGALPTLKSRVEPESPVARPKSKSFTQKLAERVAQRSAAKRARNKVKTSIEPVTNKAKPRGTNAPSANKKPADSRRPVNTSSEVVGRPKLDKRSSSIVTELVARVKNSEPIEQQNLLSLFRTHDFKFHRKVHIYGLNQLTDMWRDIEFEMPSARFVELGVSIQLADRDGAMSEKELHDFQQMTLEFSNSFNAPFEFSMDIDEALKQAQLLDQIGRRYDSMAVLNVVPKTKSGFRMADIESCARDLMMSTDKNGIFMKTEGQKHNVSVLYRLACTDGSGHFGLASSAIGPVHDLVVYMNVPATADPEGVFQQMVKDANSLATWLEGKVVDRSGRAMTQRSYSTLMQQISDIAFSMQQDGLIPGDEISKKLF